MVCLKFNSFAAPGEAYHAGATILEPNATLQLHTHDFHEVFWIANGSGIHECNGTSHSIRPGFLAFIRPSDIHNFMTNDESLCLRNIAFQTRSASTIEGSLRENGNMTIFQNAELNVQTKISPALLKELNAAFDRLAVSPRHLTTLYAFLFDLVDRLASGAQASPQTRSVPSWLLKAVEDLRNPETQEKGLAGFYSLCGRCQEHVARACRKHYGRTPSELLNQHRLERAAALLTATDDDVLSIALECGWSNLGHFYDIFKRAYRCSPGRFRQTARGTLPSFKTSI